MFGKPKRDTYSNLALNHGSTIDYILTTKTRDCISWDILDPDVNFSDHLPLMCTVKITFDSNGLKLRSTTDIDKHQPHEHIQLRWDHADLASYYRFTGEHLESILLYVTEVSRSYDQNDQQIDYKSVINYIYDDIVSTLVVGANQYVPHCRKNFV